MQVETCKEYALILETLRIRILYEVILKKKMRKGFTVGLWIQDFEEPEPILQGELLERKILSLCEVAKGRMAII